MRGVRSIKSSSNQSFSQNFDAQKLFPACIIATEPGNDGLDGRLLQRQTGDL